MQGILDCWTFIQGLSWLQPDITSSTLSIDIEYQPHLPTHLKTDKVSLWLYRSLETHTLSQKLSWLLSDKEHLNACYYENAFMLQEKYTEATLICLRAVEHNDPSLLSEINPCLFYSNLNAKDFYKVHRRCSSFPDAANYSKWNVLPKKIVENIIETEVDTTQNVKTKKELHNRNICGKLKPWRSLPNLTVKGIQIRRRSYTMIKSCSNTNSPAHLPAFKKEDKLSPSVLQINYSELTDSHADRSKKIKTKVDECKDYIEVTRSIPDGVIQQETKDKSITERHIILPLEDSLNLALNIVKSAPDYTFSGNFLT